MTRSDKLLYHQIHPFKLLVDFGTSFASTWLIWEAHWSLAVGVGFLPSIITSAFLVALADLERYRHTALGLYIASHLTPSVTVTRILGQLLMWTGAAVHIPWLLPFGFIVIVFAWLHGLVSPVRRDGPHVS